MNKSDLIAAIAKGAKLPMQNAEKRFSVALASMQKTFTQHEGVSLVSFGQDGIKKRANSTMRSP